MAVNLYQLPKDVVFLIAERAVTLSNGRFDQAHQLASTHEVLSLLSRTCRHLFNMFQNDRETIETKIKCLIVIKLNDSDLESWLFECPHVLKLFFSRNPSVLRVNFLLDAMRFSAVPLIDFLLKLNEQHNLGLLETQDFIVGFQNFHSPNHEQICTQILKLQGKAHSRIRTIILKMHRQERMEIWAGMAAAAGFIGLHSWVTVKLTHSFISKKLAL